MKLFDLMEHIDYNEILHSSNIAISTITLNSKEVKKGSLFIALDGQKHKGVDFVEEIIKQGASCIVAEKKYKKKLEVYEFPVILVDDIMSALHQIAKWYKSLFFVYTIAVTGSNGKTTTKEMISHILKAKYKVLKNEKNYNNEIGVPLTIFKLRKHHQVLVIELGINHKNEMERLAEMVQPDMAIITNVGSTHLEFLKNEKTVATEKSKILHYTKEKYFINYHNKYKDVFKAQNLQKIYVERQHTSANYHFSNIRSLEQKGFLVKFKNKQIKFSLYGKYNLDNLIMSMAVASEMKVPLYHIVKQVQTFYKLENRARIFRKRNLFLVDESYNSNYSALLSGLKTIDSWNNFQIKIAIIGEMKELGSKSIALHSKIADWLNHSSFQFIFLTGKETKIIKEKYSGTGQIYYYANKEKLSHHILSLDLSSPTVIYIKGSRGNRLEIVVQKIVEKKRMR